MQASTGNRYFLSDWLRRTQNVLHVQGVLLKTALYTKHYTLNTYALSTLYTNVHTAIFSPMQP